MRRLGVVILLLASFAAPARAQYGSVRLAWNDCGSAGTSARAFACNTNSGSDVLYVSFLPGPASGAIDQFETTLSIGNPDYSVVPDWWAFTPATGCRRGALLASGDFTAASGACADPWTGLAFTSLAITPVSFYDGQVRRMLVKATVSIPFAAAAPLDPATEYYGARLTISHQKTVGAGACAGCSQSFCIALHFGATSTVGNPTNPVRTTLFPDRNFSVTWNGGVSCDRLVPVKNRTWGALKSLYD